MKILGPSASLPLSDLPTLRDVLKHCLLLRERHAGYSKHYPVSVMANEMVPLLKGVWFRANALLTQQPIAIGDSSIASKISRSWTLLSNIANKQKVLLSSRQSFFKGLDKLFTILTCNCPFLSCGDAQCYKERCEQVHIKCDCPKESKVSTLAVKDFKDGKRKNENNCIQC